MKLYLGIWKLKEQLSGERSLIENAAFCLRSAIRRGIQKALQKGMALAERIPGPSAKVIDGMSLIQKMKRDQKSFGQMASTLLSTVLHEGSQSIRTDVVFDMYKLHSIKNLERSARRVDHKMQFKQIFSV